MLLHHILHASVTLTLTLSFPRAIIVGWNHIEIKEINLQEVTGI